MNDEKYKETLLELAVRFGDYDSHAYAFVNNAVTHTVKAVGRKADGKGSRHVSGQELIEGTLDYALEEYDFLAPEVLSYWGIRSGTDLGILVYRMISAGILSASQEDRREDFNGPEDLPGILRGRLAQRKPAELRKDPLPPIA